MKTDCWLQTSLANFAKWTTARAAENRKILICFFNEFYGQKTMNEVWVDTMRALQTGGCLVVLLCCSQVFEIVANARDRSHYSIAKSFVDYRNRRIIQWFIYIYSYVSLLIDFICLFARIILLYPTILLVLID